MRHVRATRWGGRAMLAVGLLGSTGCIHNHYYGQLPACAPATSTATAGAVCEVPQAGSGLVIAQTPTRTTVVGLPSRVVINSEPMGTRPPTRGAGRFPWQRTEPEAVATRVEGAT